MQALEVYKDVSGTAVWHKDLDVNACNDSILYTSCQLLVDFTSYFWLEESILHRRLKVERRRRYSWKI